MTRRESGQAIVTSILLLVVAALIGFIGWYIYETDRSTRILLDNKPPSILYKPRQAATVVAIGDVACDPKDRYFAANNPSRCQSKATYLTAASQKPKAILALGDLQYENGTYQKFMASYDKDWGKAKSLTYPVPGNHEYETSNAAGYYEYFKTRHEADGNRGYYAFQLGKWRLIALNSNCKHIGGCHDGSPQIEWLKQQLAASKNQCVLAYWHHPYYSSGRYAKDPDLNLTKPFWEQMRAHKVDIVLNGHEHFYERFDLQNAAAEADPDGTRQFTVGTGGKSLHLQDVPAANTQRIVDDRYGVLVLQLEARSYSWKFVATNGDVLDNGSTKCH